MAFFRLRQACRADHFVGSVLRHTGREMCKDKNVIYEELISICKQRTPYVKEYAHKSSEQMLQNILI